MVRRAADGSPRVWEVRGVGVGCPLVRSNEFHDDTGALQTVGLTQSREGKRERQWSGETRTGVR
ncbi:MAG: hypothetical protein ACKON9_07510, partial [Planctomycetaceae bacterium]